MKRTPVHYPARRRRGGRMAVRGARAADGDAGGRFLNASSPEAFTDRPRAFRNGLKEAGFVEGENVAIEYRWGRANTIGPRGGGVGFVQCEQDPNAPSVAGPAHKLSKAPAGP
jgi:hypothetical protein